MLRVCVTSQEIIFMHTQTRAEARWHSYAWTHLLFSEKKPQVRINNETRQ
jgi:hypothetical protein